MESSLLDVLVNDLNGDDSVVVDGRVVYKQYVDNTYEKLTHIIVSTDDGSHLLISADGEVCDYTSFTQAFVELRILRLKTKHSSEMAA